MGKYKAEGQGLLFTGFPTNVRQFYGILAQEGCHPRATHRILSRIDYKGFDKLTVTSTLNFDWIKSQLQEIGVKMDFIEAEAGWYERYENGPWPKKDLPLRLQGLEDLTRKAANGA